jgi:dinuclear metal center YbgI/SA1388 family protein
MMPLGEVCRFLEALAPPVLAASWDNVGLLVGDHTQPVQRVMTCLTITPPVVEEAIAHSADLVVTHHPLPFQPLRRITADEPVGQMLLDLIRGGVGVYSPHTALDSAAEGINQQWAQALGLTQIAPLEPHASLPPPLGTGRWGLLPDPCSLKQLGQRIKAWLGLDHLHLVGDAQQMLSRVAIACGSGGSLLTAAAAHGCQVLVTGEARLHTCYEALARGMALILTGHYASERFAVQWLADRLAREFPSLTVWASLRDRDPLTWL